MTRSAKLPDRDDTAAKERWVDEGGRVAAEPALEWEESAPTTPRRARADRQRVLIAGGGVAGVETLLALRALAGSRVDITILAPELKFVNRSMAVDHPSDSRPLRGLRLRDIATDLDARTHRGALGRVEPERHVIVTRDGGEVHYDHLVLALGARPQREWQAKGVLNYRDVSDAHEYRRLLRQLKDGRVRRVAFVKPDGASWPLPLYELVLAAAAECDACGAEVELSLVTPEVQPLESFGAPASAAARAALDASGVRLYSGSHGVPSRPGRLIVTPGGRRLHVDRIVTLPRLVGPKLRGVPFDPAGFIRTDAHGRVLGIRDVFGAGDATAFPIKQGGVAAQQADAVAAAIAAFVGADVSPRPFRPVLRGLLTAGGAALYIRARIATGAGDDCAVSEQPLWWPPNRLCGHYLAPYLSSLGGGVMFHDEDANPVTVAPDLGAPDGRRVLGELADLSPR